MPYAICAELDNSIRALRKVNGVHGKEGVGRSGKKEAVGETAWLIGIIGGAEGD